MSALTDLRARITGADGHLLDRTTIAAELERAIAEEHAQSKPAPVEAKATGELVEDSFLKYLSHCLRAAESVDPMSQHASTLRDVFAEYNSSRYCPTPVKTNGALVEEMTVYNNTVIKNVDSEIWRQVDTILSRHDKGAL